MLMICCCGRMRNLNQVKWCCPYTMHSNHEIQVFHQSLITDPGEEEEERERNRLMEEERKALIEACGRSRSTWRVATSKLK
jgi:hypothetical protein